MENEISRKYKRYTAFSFHSELGFSQAAALLGAREDWLGKPALNGQWLCRDNDRWGDYLSHYDYHGGDERHLARISIFFDDEENYIALKFESAVPGIEQPWQEHLAFAMNHVLPMLGARDVAPADFEK